MKSLALLTVAGALSLCGSAFFELWTPPGLENLPTYRTVLNQTSDGNSDKPEAPSGVIAVSSAVDFIPQGMTSTEKDRPFITLKAPKKPKLASFPTSKPAQAQASTKKLPPRWYTSQPVPVVKPKPKPANAYVYRRYGYHSYGYRNGASSRVTYSRSGTTSRNRGSRVRSSRR